MRERTIAAYLKRQVKRHHGKATKIKGEGETGIPDYLVGLQHVNGIPLLHLVETKKPKGGVLSERQKWVHEEYARIGIKVWVTFTKQQVDTFIYEACFS